MSEFNVIPAIDLRGGHVVRLSQGKPFEQTKYDLTPDQAAADWLEQGARWLHIVNLDGVFGENTGANEAVLGRLIRMTSTQMDVQLGGGLRSLEQIKAALDAGVKRVILGTAAIEAPDFGLEALKKFGPERIVFGFDTRDGNLMTHGWKRQAEFTALSLGERFSNAGAQTVVFTNIKRDGMQTGVDWMTAQELAKSTGLEVIASGGTSTLEDVARVAAAGLAGVIIGRALYEGNFTLKEALRVS